MIPGRGQFRPHLHEGWLKKFFPFFLLFIILTGCSYTSTPALASGVEGHVTIGPICPVVQINNPCPDKPYQATLTILDARGKKILKFQTDANGYFHVALAAGDYVMHPESPNVMPHAPGQSFTVMADKFTRLDITYDSGIR